MDFDFTDEQQMLRDSVRKMMDKVATPEYIRKCDEEELYPYEVYDEWVNMGLIGVPFSEEYGGAGGNVLDMVIIGEELGRKGYDFVGAYATSVFNGLNVFHNGTEEQKRTFIPQLIRGDIRMSISMTEPNAGSDVGAMESIGRRDGDDWVLNGQKVFATGAEVEKNIINLYVKTAPGADHRQGISLFLVNNDHPGVEIRRLKTLGRKMVGTNEIFLNDVRIGNERLVGESNKGWDYLLSGLLLERITTSAAYVGNAQTVVDEALRYSRERKQFGREIGSFQAIAHMLADMQTEVDAARLLTYRAAHQLAKEENALREVSMAKLFGSETFAKVANMGMQIFGGYGYIMEYDMQRHFRDARITTVTAGTSQMQRNMIARTMGIKVK